MLGYINDTGEIRTINHYYAIIYCVLYYNVSAVLKRQPKGQN
jgi:hypothetical protein